VLRYAKMAYLFTISASKNISKIILKKPSILLLTLFSICAIL